MRLRDLITTALHGLSRQKLRCLLTVTGVALGSMLVFSCISGTIGVLDSVNERLLSHGRLTSIMTMSGSVVDKSAAMEKLPDTLSSERRERLAQSLARRKSVPLRIKDAEWLKTLPGVRSANPRLRWGTTVALGSEQIHTTAAARRDLVAAIAPLVVAGRAPRKQAPEALISEELLYKLNVRSDEAIEQAIGQTLVLRGNRLGAVNQSDWIRNRLRLLTDLLEYDLTAEQREFLTAEVADFERRLARQPGQSTASPVPPVELTIAGVYRSASASDINRNPLALEFGRPSVIVAYEPACDFWHQNYSHRSLDIEVHAKSVADIDGIVEAVEKRGYRTWSVAEVAEQIRTAVLLITGVMTAIAATAFLIAGLGMMNTMIMTVMERRREIGILKSIGARDSDVLRMFLFEGSLVGLLGGVIGLSGGWLLTGLTTDYVREFVEQRIDEPVPSTLFVYPLWLVFGTPLLATTVTTLASFLPARRAARLDPVATLRAL